MNTSLNITESNKNKLKSSFSNSTREGLPLSHIPTTGRHAIASFRQGGTWSYDIFANGNRFFEQISLYNSNFYKI